MVCPIRVPVEPRAPASAHVVIDSGYVDGNFRRRPGCAVCGMPEALAKRHPKCPGPNGSFSIARADQKAQLRRAKRRKRQRGAK